MFSLGLHFSLRKLAAVGATAVIAATLEIVLMVLVGYEIGRMFGWSSMDSLFLGAILSISSTTIIIKALGDLGRMKERFAELIFGILIVEDILAIAMIALLRGIAMTKTLAIGAVVGTLLKLAIFLAVVLVVGLLIVPPLLRYVGAVQEQRDAAGRGAGALLRRVAAGGEDRVQRRARRVPDRRDRRRGARGGQDRRR